MDSSANFGFGAKNELLALHFNFTLILLPSPVLMLGSYFGTVLDCVCMYINNTTSTLATKRL